MQTNLHFSFLYDIREDSIKNPTVLTIQFEQLLTPG